MRTVTLWVRSPEGKQFGDAEIVKGGLSCMAALERLCDGARCVLHLAGLIAAPSRAAFEETNVFGTKRVAEAAQRAGVARFVALSSLAAREPKISAYAATKRGGEDMVRSVLSGMSWTILRPPAVYGPGDKATLPLLQQLTRRVAFAPVNRESRFSLIHVRDLVRALIAQATDTSSEKTYELDDGRRHGYSWQEMADSASRIEGHPIRTVYLPKGLVAAAARIETRFAGFSGRPPQITPDKVDELFHSDWVCRTNLLQDQTSWAPETGFDVGFRETVAWYRKEGWL